MANVELLDQSDGHLTPNFDHTGKQVGMTYIERAAKLDWKADGIVGGSSLQRCEMAARKRGDGLVLMDSCEVDPEQQKQIGDPGSIDNAQAVELMNAGYGVGILDLGDPCLLYTSRCV